MNLSFNINYSKVSVIIPAYNSARFLPEAIESVLNQTCAAFEIIVVDDGSIDNTKEICCRYPTIKYIYQANQGLVGARNTGLRASQGDYLLFFDSDDRLFPNAIEAGSNCINNNPEVGFVFGNYIFQSINPDGSYTTQEIYDNQKEVANYENILAGKLKLQVASVLFRRIAVESVGGFNPNAKDLEDYNLFLRVAREFPIRFHNEVVFEYRYNGTNISGNSSRMLLAALHSHGLQWNYVYQTGNKKYKAAYELGKQAWIKLFGNRLPYEIMKAVQDGQWVKALGILRLILNHDPNLKIIDQEIYEASHKVLLSHLRKLPIQSSLAYWKQQLAGAPPLLSLPTDRPRAAEQAFRGSTRSFLLSQELTLQLSLLSKQKDITLFTTLLATFDTLLYRYIGTDDIVIGSPIINRDSCSEVFINAVVLRTDMSGNPSFQKLLGQVRKVALAAEIHQDVPFEILVEELHPQQDLSYSPLFQIMFAFEEDVSLQKLELSNLTASPWVLENNEGKFDLALLLKQIDDRLEGKWLFNTDLFDISTIERMSGHFQILLEGIVADPEQSISELPLLTEKEQRQLLFEWNNTQTEYPKHKCIHQLFEEQVERTPDAVAVVFEQQQLTYRELNSRANQLAHYLMDLGIGADALVGICVERSLEMLVGLLGILKAGGAYVPLDPAYPTERLAYMLSDSQMTVLLTQKDLISLLPEHQAKAVCLDTDGKAISQEKEENPLNDLTSEKLAYVIYTSGSTGKPKGVQIPHGAVTNFLNSMQRKPGLTDKDILLAITTISFDIAVLELYLPLISGAKVVLASREVVIDGLELLRLLKESNATVMQATPATWQLLLAAGWNGQSQPLKILCGGEALTQELANQLSTRASSLWNMYGPTEATVWATTYEVVSQSLPNARKSAALIGRPIDNTQTYILDRYLQPVPIGVSGELYIGGACLARGYLNRPDLTAEKFIANPFSNDPSSRLYRTGDVAKYLPSGEIEYIGRIDNQVKIRGFRIELGEIEVSLAQHPDIRELAVIVREDIPSDKRIVAYIVLHKTAQIPTVSSLRDFLSQKLPQYMIPSAFVTLESLPLTPNGKVDRRTLPSPDISKDLGEKFITPRDEVEQQLLNIWKKVLGHNSISIKDNFFDLGGHSLSSVRLIFEIENTFKCRLPLSTIFQIGTIEEISKLIRKKASEKNSDYDFPAGLTVEEYRNFLANSAGRTGLRLGKRGLIINVLPESQVSSQPFVWIGSVKTAKKLKLKQPIYVIPGASLSSSMNSYNDYISKISTLLVDELLTVRPQLESYSLGGWCYDGLVAMEMAQQLQKLGKKVNLLTLLDVSGRSKHYKVLNFIMLNFGNLRYHLFQISKLSLQQKTQYIAQRLKGKTIYFNEVKSTTHRPDIIQPVDLLTKAANDYKPNSYIGKVLLVIGNKQIVNGQKEIKYPDLSWLFPSNGFGNLFQDKVWISKIQCDHLELVEDPYCEEVGQSIQQKLLS
jgi:amino acid adenylation domain-containing protein